MKKINITIKCVCVCVCVCVWYSFSHSTSFLLSYIGSPSPRQMVSHSSLNPLFPPSPPFSLPQHTVVSISRQSGNNSTAIPSLPLVPSSATILRSHACQPCIYSLSLMTSLWGRDKFFLVFFLYIYIFFLCGYVCDILFYLFFFSCA